MKIELYSRVIVNRDFPEQHLKAGDVATIVEYVEHPQGGEEGAILEIFNALGETLDIATVPVSAIEPVQARHVPSVRLIERA
jgi:hypothetical protein